VGECFLLVPAYPGCPGSKAVKRSLLLLVVCCDIQKNVDPGFAAGDAAR